MMYYFLLTFLPFITSQKMFWNQTGSSEKSQEISELLYSKKWKQTLLRKSFIWVINTKAGWKKIQVISIAVDGFRSSYRETNTSSQ